MILDPDEFARHATLARVDCSDGLRDWVENYWSVRWTLPDGATYRSSTVPVASCNLTVERGCCRDGVVQPGVYLTGVVARQRFDVALTGAGGVLGVKFRPGGLTDLTGLDARTLRDAVLPATEAFPQAHRLEGLDPRDCDLAGAVERFDRLLLSLQASRSRDYAAVRRLVDELETAPATITVTGLADRCALTPRTAQRLCRRYVGVGPQWLIARRRVHRAVCRLHEHDCTLAQLAAECGWFDQAHMRRDFVALIGEPPSTYRDRQRRR